MEYFWQVAKTGDSSVIIVQLYDESDSLKRNLNFTLNNKLGITKMRPVRSSYREGTNSTTFSLNPFGSDSGYVNVTRFTPWEFSGNFDVYYTSNNTGKKKHLTGEFTIYHIYP